MAPVLAVFRRRLWLTAPYLSSGACFIRRIADSCDEAALPRSGGSARPKVLRDATQLHEDLARTPQREFLAIADSQSFLQLIHGHQGVAHSPVMMIAANTAKAIA